MKILVSGASGMLGRSLIDALHKSGHQTGALVRSESRRTSEHDVVWSPLEGIPDSEMPKLEQYDAVVHLAGEPIFGLRWTEEKKRRIRQSRVVGTRVLSDALAGLESKPQVLISASAVGIYGDRGDEELTEGAPPGTGFLADVAQEWEEATASSAAAGIRVVNLRLGVIMSGKGGMLQVVRKPFRLGLGGRLGSGRQWMSWVSLEDAVGVTLHALECDELSGGVNVSSPNPVTNSQFTVALGKALHRPTPFPAPSFALRLMLGEMADELMLASVRALPRQLEATGYSFQHRRIQEALETAFADQR